MDKTGHILGSSLIERKSQSSSTYILSLFFRPKFESRTSNIEFEPYTAEDEGSLIRKIDGCYISRIKVVFFVFLCIIFTPIIPLLLIKWSDKVYRLLLFSYTNIYRATHFAVHGPCTCYYYYSRSIRNRSCEQSYGYRSSNSNKEIYNRTSLLNLSAYFTDFTLITTMKTNRNYFLYDLTINGHMLLFTMN